MTGNCIISSIYGKIEVPNLQYGIMKHDSPGLVYLPPGIWEENVVIAQHSLTIVGEGRNTILENKTEESPVTIMAPSVHLINVAVRNGGNAPAITYNHASAPQGVLHNVTILESGSHGVVKREQPSGPRSSLTTIVDCNFHNIAGHGIVAESGSGPQNLVRGNRGESIDGYFIRWSANASFLLDNRCQNAPVYLTPESGANVVHGPDDMVIVDKSDDNLLL